MNVILLPGKSGTRLWPLSNKAREKQFLKIFKLKDGNHESMVQRLYRMIKEVDNTAKVTITSSLSQVSSIQAQLGNKVEICSEPFQGDFFSTVILASAYLKRKGIGEDESIVTCPVTAYGNRDFFTCLNRLSKEIEKGNDNFIFMGIEPIYPSVEYGYIIPERKDKVSKIKELKEPPNKTLAEKYIKQGGVWNVGIFAYKLKYILSLVEKMIGTSDFDALCHQHDKLKEISFKNIVAKEKNISLIRFSGNWKDLDTWGTLSEIMSDSTSGNSTAIACNNIHVINELSNPLIVMGVKNAVVVATPDGILVADKEKSSNLEKYVDKQRPMYERRLWGEYKVLNYSNYENGDNSLVKELVISPNQHISYQLHHHRTEIWTFTEGVGELIINGVIKKVSRGDSVVIPPKTKHAIKGLTKLHIIEVQLGKILSEDDIVRFDWKW